MSEKCWECRVKVLPLFGVSDSHTFQFSSFGTGNWEWFPAQSSKFSFMSGNSQSPWEALVLLQDGREGFKLHFLKGCLAWTSCVPHQSLSRAGVGKTDRQIDRHHHPAEGKESQAALPAGLLCAAHFHLCTTSPGWVCGTSSCRDLELWSDKLESPEQMRPHLTVSPWEGNTSWQASQMPVDFRNANLDIWGLQLGFMEDVLGIMLFYINAWIPPHVPLQAYWSLCGFRPGKIKGRMQEPLDCTL